MAETLSGKKIGRGWHLGFLGRHTDLRASFTRCLENKRNKATHPSIILDYFIKYKEIIDKYQLLKKLIFNVDKKEFLKSIAR